MCIYTQKGANIFIKNFFELECISGRNLFVVTGAHKFEYYVYIYKCTWIFIYIYIYIYVYMCVYTNMPALKKEEEESPLRVWESVTNAG